MKTLPHGSVLLPLRRHLLLSPGAVSIAAFAVTIAATGFLFVSNRNVETVRFENAVQAAQDRIEMRIGNHTALLRGTAGLFAAGPVDKSSFQAYVRRLRLPLNYPAVRSIGYAGRMNRNDDLPGLRIHPDAGEREAVPVLFMAPDDPTNQMEIGFDMASDPARLEAMVLARDTGRWAMTGLLSVKPAARERGFLMLIPVYRDGFVPDSVEMRRAKLLGFIFFPFEAHELFQDIFGHETRPRVDFRIYLGEVPSEGNFLFDSSGGAVRRPRFTARRHETFGGRLWRIDFQSRPELEAGSLRPLVALLGLVGALLSGSLFFIGRAQVRARRLAEQIAEERRASESEIRALNADLGRRVAERTRELEQSVRELDAFSYSVSHDLRAPLRHIIGYAKRLRDRLPDPSDPEVARFLDTIAHSAESGGKLVDDLLAFSRLGRAGLQKSQVDTEALVQDVIRDLAPDTAGRQVQWNISDLPVTLADPAMLRLVFLNLLGNALKYTRLRTEAVISVSSSLRPGFVEFTVADNGVGFDPAYASKLFKVFERLHSPDEYEGTGIGLAIVHRVVTRHGGTTSASSTPGQGATFRFTLPR